MKKPKHTPGPWKAHFNVIGATIPGHIIKTDDPDQVHSPVASLWVGGGTHGKPMQIANAHLIAAAPELLFALELLIAELPMKRDWLNPDVEKLARHAVKRAMGDDL